MHESVGVRGIDVAHQTTIEHDGQPVSGIKNGKVAADRTHSQLDKNTLHLTQDEKATNIILTPGLAFGDIY